MPRAPLRLATLALALSLSGLGYCDISYAYFGGTPAYSQGAIDSNWTKGFVMEEGNSHVYFAPVEKTTNYGQFTQSTAWAQTSVSVNSATTYEKTDVDGLSGFRTSIYETDAFGIEFTSGVLHFTADEAYSKITMTGSTFNTWDTSWIGKLVNAHLSINGIDVSLPDNPTADEIVYNQDGWTVTLNKTIGHTLPQDGFAGVYPIFITGSNITLPNGTTLFTDGANFGTTSVGMHIVPEPASTLALAFLAGGLIFRRRREPKN